MKDTQSQGDHRGVASDLVGGRRFRWPIIACDRQFEKQATADAFKFTAPLPSEFKGACNYVRFVEVEWQR